MTSARPAPGSASASAPGAIASLPPRSIPLADSDWRLWPHALVRSAGFPLDGVLALADLGVAEAADRLGADERDGDDLDRAWRESVERAGTALAELASSPSFRLALTWQNSRFLDTAVDPLLKQLRDGGPRRRKRRVREQAVASYWQRYCTKNDSIGFFGPVTWASVGRVSATTASHGPRLVDRATVLLEAWPVEALARTLDRDLDLALWLAPRRTPFLRVLDGRVRLPGGQTEPVAPLTAALLKRADGRVTARQLAADLAAEFPDRTHAAIFDLMRVLRDRRWLVWKLELPVGVHPEEELREILRRVDDDGLRAAASAPLERMVDARDRVRLRWDDESAVREALAELEDAFTAATGMDPTRNHGLSYAGRTLAYLECRRDLTVELGDDIVAALAPVTLLLDSARWLCRRIREAFLPHVEDAYCRIEAGGVGRPMVADLWRECLPLLGRQLGEIVDASVAELQQRWRSILRYEDGAARTAYRASDLTDAVQESFAAQGPAWSEARWCCPDVMIAAPSQDHLRRGDFQLVLGEIHPATNSVDYGSMVPHHPDATQLLGCIDADFPGPRLLVALPRESRPRLTIRSHPALIRDRDRRLVLMPHTPLPAVGRVSLAGDVPVERRADGLVLVMGDGDEFDVLDVFAEALKTAVVTHFDVLGAGWHPRVTVDRLVVARRTWTFAPSALAFAFESEERIRYAAARRWARALGLPRHVFVKSALEPKPFHVDFAAPLLVALLVVAARRAMAGGAGEDTEAVRVVEMLPDPDGTWLADSAGRRYAAEFRLVAVDCRGDP